MSAKKNTLAIALAQQRWKYATATEHEEVGRKAAQGKWRHATGEDSTE